MRKLHDSPDSAPPSAPIPPAALPPLPPDAYVRERDLEGRTPYRAQTYAKLRHDGGGPPFFKKNRAVYYRWSDVIAWLESGGTRASTSDAPFATRLRSAA